MNSKCIGCFKPATKGSDICIGCKFNEAHNTVSSLEMSLGEQMPEDIKDEIIYEVFCRMSGIKKEDQERMERSGLATLISKCADTAIYLGKKRFVDMDDMKILLFSLERNGVYITNGDTVIRITGLPEDMLDGLRNDLPAYDYIYEKFIPNPLPYEPEEMDKVFNEVMYHSVCLPVHYLLRKIFNTYPEATKRRGMFAVIDVGFGMFENSIIIPGFAIPRNQQRYWALPDGRCVFVDKRSIIPNDAIESDTRYVGFVTKNGPEGIYVNVYKKHEDLTTVGMYDATIPMAKDDVHPYELARYGEKDLIKFQLASTIGEGFENLEQKMRAYENFRPIVVELEYLYEILLLFGTFNYDLVYMHSKNPDLPIILEGVRRFEDQPTIEAAMAVVAIGRDGREAEEELEYSLVRSISR